MRPWAFLQGRVRRYATGATGPGQGRIIRVFVCGSTMPTVAVGIAMGAAIFASAARSGQRGEREQSDVADQRPPTDRAGTAAGAEARARHVVASCDVYRDEKCERTEQPARGDR